MRRTSAASIQTLLETNGYQALVAQTCVMGMTMFISYNPTSSS